MSSVSTGDLKEVVRQAMKENQQIDFVAHVLACPDCYSSVVKNMREHSEVECEDCHLPLGSTEFASKIPSCPFCGGQHAQKVEKEG
jgi:Primosomal protein N'' (replication factor Y) - superfamily II helicase